MEKGKTIRKIIPVNTYDIAGCESWLESMAAKGLLLEGFGLFFAHFNKGEPQQMTYRLEPVAAGEEIPGKEIHASYIQASWEYVTYIKESFSIYRIAAGEMSEIHTDFLSQSDTFEALEKKLRGNAILITLAAIVIIGVIMSLYLSHDEPVLYIAEYGSFVSQCMYIVLEVFIAARSVLDAGRIKGYIKQLRSGETLCHQKSYTGSRNWKVASWILITGVFIIGIGTSYKEMNQSWVKPAAEVEITLPVISLAELEDNENFKYNEAVSRHGRYYENTVAYQWTVLAPVQYEVEESGEVKGEMWADESGIYEPSLRSDYYQVAFAGLAEPLLNDLISRYAYRYDELAVEELETDDFDRAVIAAEDESQYLFACRGKQVIFLRYHGKVELKSRLKEIAAALY